MTILEFIEERCEGLEHSARGIEDHIYMSVNGDFLDEEMTHITQAIRDIVDLHNNWVVVVEGPTTFDVETRGYNPISSDGIMMSMSKHVAFVTEQKYREHFGTEPPTSPMIRAIARIWKDHPDYREEWA